MEQNAAALRRSAASRGFPTATRPADLPEGVHWELTNPERAAWDGRPGRLGVRDLDRPAAITYSLPVYGNAVVESIVCDQPWLVVRGAVTHQLPGSPYVALPVRVTPARDLAVVVDVRPSDGAAPARCTIESSLGPLVFSVGSTSAGLPRRNSHSIEGVSADGPFEVAPGVSPAP